MILTKKYPIKVRLFYILISISFILFFLSLMAAYIKDYNGGNNSSIIDGFFADYLWVIFHYPIVRIISPIIEHLKYSSIVYWILLLGNILFWAIVLERLITIVHSKIKSHRNHSENKLQ